MYVTYDMHTPDPNDIPHYVHTCVHCIHCVYMYIMYVQVYV